MSTQNTPGERSDGPPGDAGGSRLEALSEFLLTGRMRLVTIFAAIEAFLVAVALVFEFGLDLSVLGALFAAAAFIFLFAVVVALAVWLAFVTIRAFV